MAEPLHRQFEERLFEETAFPIAMRATVIEDVKGADEGAMVTLYMFDGGTIPFGPCPWMPRGTLRPSKGDSALVIIDEQEEAWIINWWPYDISPPLVEDPDDQDDTFVAIPEDDPGTIPPDEGDGTP